MALLPVVLDQNNPVVPFRRRIQAAIRRAFDLGMVGVIALFATPVVLIASILVKCTSSGPVIYSQVRVGRNGKQFRLYKLRSMYHNCEAASGIRWATRADPRITPVGRVLRKLHIDELPQLWNVIRGDMNIVVPRPERPEIIDTLIGQLPDYPRRLKVRPGLTGLAQIQLPADTDIHSVRDKLAFDLTYIADQGGWLDLRILFGTAVYLAGFSYGTVRMLARLPQSNSDCQLIATNPAISTAETSVENPVPTQRDIPRTLVSHRVHGPAQKAGS